MSEPCVRKSVLVLGSGPIIVGQGAEFDYAGSQACLAYKSLGFRVIVMNDNPTSFMTSGACSDEVLLEAVTPCSVVRAMRDHECDFVASSFGGQLALNAVMSAVKSGDLLESCVLGTPRRGVDAAEDRAEFAALMRAEGIRCAEHVSVTCAADVDQAIDNLGSPVIVRTSFALGGSGVVVARSGADAAALLMSAEPGGSIAERSLLGLCEVEFEVVRDVSGQCIAVAGMENLDPVGVHTGDSVVITPIASLDDDLVHELRACAIAVASAVGVVGACNVQLAVSTLSREWWVIECNPRTSRSSAMASKATGYPIARVAAMLTAGKLLSELRLESNGAPASMEPALDFVAVKIPAWSDSRFAALRSDATLGVAMRATGESMGIGASISEAWFKAARGAGIKRWLACAGSLREPRPSRCQSVIAKLAAGTSWSDVSAETSWPVAVTRALSDAVASAQRYAVEQSADAMLAAKRLGVPDSMLAEVSSATEVSVRRRRAAWCIRPGYELVDGVAGELCASSRYAYSTYSSDDHIAVQQAEALALIIGSGPIRIGQGVEFDCCCAESARDLRGAGAYVITLNCNPETVSTDYDASDALIFDPVDSEAVSDALWSLPAQCVTLAQLGGQAALDAACGADEAWVMSSAQLAAAELCGDREECAAALHAAEITTPSDVELSFPAIVRPSHVIGGAGMTIVTSEVELTAASELAERLGAGPVIADTLISGTEFDVDMFVRGDGVWTPGAVQQVDPPGVHSGDSRAVWPAPDRELAAVAESAAVRAARAVEAVGVCNAQVIVTSLGQSFVIEVNARASRTLTMISRAMGRSLAGEAALALIAPDHRTRQQIARSHLTLEREPVFSKKLPAVPLGPVMTSTGERVRVVSAR